MHAAYLFIVSGHFPLKSFRTSNMQPVTFAPSFKHISGSWFPFLHAKYAAVWFAHLFCKCLCEANKTLDVGALSFSDMIFLLNSATKLYYTHKQQQQRSDWLRFFRLKKRYSFLSLSLSPSLLTLGYDHKTPSLSLYTLLYSSLTSLQIIPLRQILLTHLLLLHFLQLLQQIMVLYHLDLVYLNLHLLFAKYV